MLDTPQRVRKSLAFLTQGYQQDPSEILGSAMFEEPYDEMVLVKESSSIRCASITCCPFLAGQHRVIPDGHSSASEGARLVGVFSRRLQVQERLTTQIAGTISGTAGAEGRGGGYRSRPSVPDDARGAEAALAHRDLLPARLLQEEPGHARRILNLVRGS